MNDGANRVEPDEILGWRKRRPKLYFRGTSTGGRVDNTTAFHVMHRQRLVDYGLNRTEVMDVGFVGCAQSLLLVHSVGDDLNAHTGIPVSLTAEHLGLMPLHHVLHASECPNTWCSHRN